MPRVHERAIKAKKIAQPRFEPAPDDRFRNIMSPASHTTRDPSNRSVGVRQPDKEQDYLVARTSQFGKQLHVTSACERSLESEISPSEGEFLDPCEKQAASPHVLRLRCEGRKTCRDQVGVDEVRASTTRR
jgi:hypothetical protein